MADNIVLIGFMGSGKSNAGRLLAKKLHYDFIDSDEKIEVSENLTISGIFNLKGEDYFRELEVKFLESLLKNGIKRTVLATGGGMPCSDNNLEKLKKLGTVIYLKADPKTILKRIGQETNRPVLGAAGFSGKDIKNILVNRERYYNKADITVYTDGISPAGVTEEIVMFTSNLF